MTCDDLRHELVAFHFGETEHRADIEAHLPTCSACVRAYLGIKRGIETGEDDGPRPSDIARRRLREAVARTLGVGPRRWWERPAAFAFAASAVLASMLAMRALTEKPDLPHAAQHAPAE
jgi:hypothetical protein